ncbi:RecBCD enzyme subunit RecB [Halomonadaceae bacterium LMG 33818]|uniref:exodeoxyribonuclease V subunit beta n=1 Tax=Cernens ardua TaxID=3402176 RepID=UPI003EDBCC53
MDQRLDILTLPLHGRRLIEASAGTGKTFTIAALYVRLILGLGDDAAFNRPLMPNEILVVTFTNAATEELRERIRIRLREARDVLLGLSSPDTTLADLLAVLPSENHAACAQQLDNAIRMMDDAAIFTIHGFCQRMLKRHAFDSGARFDVELTSDGSMIFDQAVEDYWRRHYYPLKPTLQHFVAGLFHDPDALADAIRIPLLADVEQRLLKDDRLIQAPATVADILSPYERHLEAMAVLATYIRQQLDIDRMRDALEDLLRQGAFKANMIKAENLQSRLEDLAQWQAADTPLLPPALVDLDKEICRLGSAYLKKAMKKGYDGPEGTLYDALDQLTEQQAALPDPSPELMAHALKVVETNIEAVKKRQGILDFNDLLMVLDEALEGPMGARLAASIRRELPVALIDEFQDTDARQYRIFDHIYPSVSPDATTDSRTHASPHEYALLLIGDPKQAIYAFRNADLFTYLLARGSVEGRYSLSKNFRSTQAVVSAVNALFSTQDNAFIEDGLNFVKNEANGRDDALLMNDTPAPAITWWLPESPESMGSDDYIHVMSEATRADIQYLLEGARAGNIGFGQHGQAITPLRASDIAILVRTGAEAVAVREALERGGIKSVYLSQKASVFNAHEAFWILQLLEAVAQPRQDRLLRAALSTRLLSDSLDAVAALVSNERYWETLVERFEGYHRDWQYRGVLAMLRRVMQDFNVASRLLARENGERSLTDLLHLGELLQSASQVLEGEQALLRWLHRAMQGSFDRWVDPESLIQRLENDESLVRVVTIHGSKGLEYPVVYLPFICNYREVRPTTSPMVIRHPEHGRVASLSPDKEQLAMADKARLAEDIRLLYVAFTRARYACRAGVVPLYKGRRNSKTPDDATTLHLSALGYLLAGGEPISGHALRGLLASLDSQHQLSFREESGTGAEQIQVIQTPPVRGETPYSEQGNVESERVPRCFTGAIDRSWWIASYTTLTENARRRVSDTIAEPLASTQMDMEVVQENTPIPPPPPGDINNFPRGPHAGTFLHGLLEMVDFGRVQESAYHAELFRLIERRLTRSRFDIHWLDTLYRWLLDFLQARFTVQGHSAHHGAEGHSSSNLSISLEKLDHWRTELEFWLSIAPAYAQQIDQLIRQYEPLGVPAEYPALAPRHLNGMLRGFIDMVAEVDGRWYLLDWKSNYLGDEPHAYDQAHMAQAMVAHRYDVQYVIYTLALHRLLRLRLPDYDYDRDMGGVFYIFLRGVGPGREGQGIFHRLPERELIESLDALFTLDTQLTLGTTSTSNTYSSLAAGTDTPEGNS